MFFYGFDSDGNKVYYNTTDNKVTMTPIYDEVPISESIVYATFDEELASYGFTSSEISAINTKINNVSISSDSVSSITIIDPVTGASSIVSNGSLLSNLALSLKNNTDYQKARVEIEKAKVLALTKQNDIQKKQLDMMDYNLLMQGQVYEQLLDNNTNIKAQTEVIKALKLSVGGSTVRVDVTPLAEANTKIAEGVASQISTNEKIIANLEKKNEHLDYLKTGSDTLKDSKGELIKPREVEAKKNAEQHTYKKDVNTYDHHANTLEVLNAVNGISGNDSPTAETDLLGLLDKLVDFDLSKFKPEQELKIYGVSNV